MAITPLIDKKYRNIHKSTFIYLIIQNIHSELLHVTFNSYWEEVANKST